MTEGPQHAETVALVVAGILAVASALLASGHAVLYKRDDRGTMMWVGLIWALPLVGPGLYLTFGINRIKRQAARLRRRIASSATAATGNLVRKSDSPPCNPSGYTAVVLPPEAEHLKPLADVVTAVAGNPLLPGNRIDPLVDAERAFAAMLAAIRHARHSVALSTYIFEHDDVGLEVATSLGDATRRGVTVRVLIDASGTLLTRHSIVGVLRRNGVRFERFLPAISLGQPVSLNLRNHRKLLIVDGRIGFTGGMNICTARLRTKRTFAPVADLHFRVEGPVVAQMQQVFVRDWEFMSGEILHGEKWFPALATAGTSAARGIVDGPDEEFERTRWTFLGALAAARRSLRILTPYFLPDASLISALNLAAMRGVTVDILLPTQGDVPFVQWASAAHWWEILRHGCRIWVAAAPFDHSKLMIVDETWVMVGTSNWDPRSLRLNFEFNLECYDSELAAVMTALFEKRKASACAVTLAMANGRSLGVRLRDGIARLWTPFL